MTFDSKCSLFIYVCICMALESPDSSPHPLRTGVWESALRYNENVIYTSKGYTLLYSYVYLLIS